MKSVPKFSLYKFSPIPTSKKLKKFGADFDKKNERQSRYEKGWKMNIEQFWMVTKLKTCELKKNKKFLNKTDFRNFKNEKSVNEE